MTSEIQQGTTYSDLDSNWCFIAKLT